MIGFLEGLRWPDWCGVTNGESGGALEACLRIDRGKSDHGI